ncbi:MAG: zf-HC2 domain-containing protein [Pyrinomonadaceae bacterium]
MKEFLGTNTCARSDEMVAYLYNEASAAEARDFQDHMQHCAACREEFAAFGEVREQIVEWRDESLGAFNSTPFVTTPAPAVISSLSERKRSALAALREFFTLSPAWLRAATACASILFCVLAVIAIYRLSHKQAPTVASQDVTTERRYTEQEMNALAEKRAQDKLAEYQRQQDASQSTATVANNNGSTVRTKEKRNAVAPPVTVAKSSPSPVAPKRSVHPLTAQEREQLAEDLGLAASKDEDDLPRLSDVLGSESN